MLQYQIGFQAIRHGLVVSRGVSMGVSIRHGMPMRRAKWRATHYGIKDLDVLMENFTESIDNELEQDSRLAADYETLSQRDAHQMYSTVYLNKQEDEANTALMRLMKYIHDSTQFLN
eukprot:Blabericola_migrator_1__3940@NODE_2195_length_3144_cov_117_170296_g1381_i0_p3_GENE_NODE_2195_length_3144_cov_117_170296_g1381_i0NODE_2195_length_3144_cov_117_170296_g1381_i0_p3_ORF_typecomplete_len117_score21_39Sdh5/PF03937_16/0_00021CHIPS/PF11434_8/0_13_NODE_2195_length_3144_cov_117_170296_g1381_i023252675